MPSLNLCLENTPAIIHSCKGIKQKLIDKLDVVKKF